MSNKDMKDKKVTDKNYDKVVFLEKQLKNAKIFQILIAVLLCGSVGFLAHGLNSLDAKVSDVQKSVEETQSFVGYEETLSTSERENKAAEVMKSVYVKEHTLSADTNREKMFSLEDGTYYVFFYVPGCPHCVEVESRLDKYIEREDKYSMYFYDASYIDASATDLKWAEDNKDIKYEATKDNLELIGTPTLMEVKPDGKASLFIGDEAIIDKLGL